MSNRSEDEAFSSSSPSSSSDSLLPGRLQLSWWCVSEQWSLLFFSFFVCHCTTCSTYCPRRSDVVLDELFVWDDGFKSMGKCLSIDGATVVVLVLVVVLPMYVNVFYCDPNEESLTYHNHTKSWDPMESTNFPNASNFEVDFQQTFHVHWKVQSPRYAGTSNGHRLIYIALDWEAREEISEREDTSMMPVAT